jgi:DegV family protein with EDD domain
MATGSVKIVTDSSAYLLPEEIARYDVRVVPLKVIFGTEVYNEGIDITNEDFYRRLTPRGMVPTTSQPPLAEFVRIYQELVRDGHPVLSIHISSRLSGTVNSALAARHELESARIEVIDCRTVALRLLILPAARMAAEGRSLAEIRDSIERLNRAINTVGMLDTLEYLWRGGRIGGARALVGAMLRIKPLLDFKGEEVKIVGRPRTTTKAVEDILAFMQARETPAVLLHVGVAHTHAPELARTLAEQVGAGFNVAELDIIELGPVLGTHAGPGFLGIAFYSDEEWRPG